MFWRRRLPVQVSGQDVPLRYFRALGLIIHEPFWVPISSSSISAATRYHTFLQSVMRYCDFKTDIAAIAWGKAELFASLATT
jgi:hypothetical protein